MAILCASIGDGLTRDGSFLDPAQSWTRAIWTRMPALISSPDQYNIWLLGPVNFSGSWIWMGGVAPSDSLPTGSDPGLRLYGETFNSVAGDTDTDGDANGWYYLALTYTSAAHTIRFYVNGVLIASDTSDLSAMAAQTAECLGSAGTGLLGGVSVAYERMWQAALTAFELGLEMASPVPVRLTNCLSASTLLGPNDLVDLVGGHNWSVAGTVEFAVGPPFTPSTETTSVAIRRLRRSPHVSDEAERIVHTWLQLDMQGGIGTTGLASDPSVSLSWSNDGGATFGNPRTATAGAVGQYLKRVYFYRLGHARDRVYEVVVSDPAVGWVLADAFTKVEKCRG